MSSEILLQALRRLGMVDVLSHRFAPWPSLQRTLLGANEFETRLGVQPVTIHSEAVLSGWLHRKALRAWPCAWAATSRFASALYASGVPYIVWEATTAQDELESISIRAARRNGNGSGAGALLHRLLSPVDERLEGAIYRAAARLVAMSQYTREQMASRHGIPLERIELLCPPPSLRFIEALGSRVRDLAAPPGLELPPRLLFVGRVTDPRKNADLLLDAFELVRRWRPESTLTIVGPYTPEWLNPRAARLRQLGVTLAGRVGIEALAESYLAHDALIVSSLQEGYGIVVAEAMHAGLPVVATKCGGPEAIVRDSGGGLLVDHTPAALAEAVIALLSNPARWAWCASAAARFGRTALSFDRFAMRVAEMTTDVLRDGKALA